MYREDLVKLKEKMQEKVEQEEEPVKGAAGKRRRGVKSGSAHGKKNEPPQSSLTLEYVHG